MPSSAARLSAPTRSVPLPTTSRAPGICLRVAAMASTASIRPFVGASLATNTATEGAASGWARRNEPTSRPTAVRRGLKLRGRKRLSVSLFDVNTSETLRRNKARLARSSNFDHRLRGELARIGNQVVHSHDAARASPDGRVNSRRCGKKWLAVPVTAG
jgi:hypothetical protein